MTRKFENKSNLNEITYKINGAVFDVSRCLGAGFLEKVYENALSLELQEQGLELHCQKPLQVYYKGKTVGEYFPDLLVNFEHPKAIIKRYVNKYSE